MQSVIRQQFRDLNCPGWSLETPPVVRQHWGSHLLTISSEHYPNPIASKVSVDGKLAQVRRGPRLHIQVLELATGDKFPTIYLPDDEVLGVAFSLDNRLAIATAHRTTIWNIENGVHLRSILTFVTSSVDSMAFSADGSHISIYSSDAKVATMYNLHTGRPTQRYKADSGVFSGKSTWLAIPRSHSVELVQWKAMSQLSTQEIQFDGEPINSRHVTFSPNEQLLGVLGSLHVFVWDIEKRKEVRRCRVTTFASLALSENQLVLCYEAGLVDVFELDGNGHRWLSTGFHRLTSYEISICEKHNFLFRVTPDDGTTMIWDSALIGTDPRPKAVLMSHDKTKLGCHGEYFAAVTDQELWVWDIQRGERIATFPAPWAFTLAAYQPLLGFLSNANENEITIVNLNDNHAEPKFKATHESVALLAFSEDGSKLALRCQSGFDNIYDNAPYVVQVWNIATKTCEWSVQAKFKASSAVISGTKMALQSPEYPHPAIIFDMSFPQVPDPLAHRHIKDIRPSRSRLRKNYDPILEPFSKHRLLQDGSRRSHPGEFRSLGRAFGFLLLYDA
jgi:WD40 repeat protein